MIKESIKIQKEAIQTQSHYVAPTKTKPKQMADSVSERVGVSIHAPSVEEYTQACKEWGSLPVIMPGQPLFIKFHPQGPTHERIFSRILPRDCSNVSMHSSPKEIQIIEVWNKDTDVFMRVAPSLCSVLNKL
jgi:hypothetical protein